MSGALPVSEALRDWSLKFLQQINGEASSMVTIKQLQFGYLGETPVPNAIEVSRAPNEGVAIAFDSLPGFRYMLQRSTSLESWETTNQEITGDGERLQFIDESAQQLAARYYRIAVEAVSGQE